MRVQLLLPMHILNGCVSFHPYHLSLAGGRGWASLESPYSPSNEGSKFHNTEWSELNLGNRLVFTKVIFCGIDNFSFFTFKL